METDGLRAEVERVAARLDERREADQERRKQAELQNRENGLHVRENRRRLITTAKAVAEAMLEEAVPPDVRVVKNVQAQTRSAWWRRRISQPTEVELVSGWLLRADADSRGVHAFSVDSASLSGEQRGAVLSTDSSIWTFPIPRISGVIINPVAERRDVYGSFPSVTDLKGRSAGAITLAAGSAEPHHAGLEHGVFSDIFNTDDPERDGELFRAGLYDFADDPYDIRLRQDKPLYESVLVLAAAHNLEVS